MFLSEDSCDFQQEDKNTVIYEAFNQIALTEGFEDGIAYLEKASDWFVYGKSKAGEEIEEIKREVKDLNNQLEDNKIDLSEMKSKWNSVVGNFFKLGAYMDVASVPAHLRWSDIDTQKLVLMNLLSAAISFIASRFIIKSGDKKDLNVLKKDVEKMLTKIQEIKKNNKNKKRLEEIEVKLQATLQRIERASSEHKLKLKD